MNFGLVNKIIQKLGRSGYTIDNAISTRNIYIILINKFFELFRGFFLRILFKKTTGLVFIGKRTSIKHCNLISTGKTLYIGDNVIINALSLNGIQFGNNVSIHNNTIIDCTGGIRSVGEGLRIGNNVGFSPFCFIQVRGNVKIGNNVIFGPGVKLFSESHNIDDPDKFINEQGESRKGVIIEDGVWVGSDVTILDGVTIGNNAVVAAKSLVNKNVPPFSIVAGIPAKIIKYRKVDI
ncbi:MAG TPA: acyltransferase [Bacteroidales bacterium]|nr:acyltransferase [Bacteroidales bacterium]